MIKVILADDHQIVIDGLKILINQEKDIQIVGEALNGKDLLKQLSCKEVDVLVLDIEMPVMDGIEATSKVKKDYPNIKILILSMYDNEEFIKKLIQAGASGYILKNRGKEELINAIRRISEGKNYFGDAVINILLEELKRPATRSNEEKIRLTKREGEVLKLIAEGLSTPQIALKLHIANSTVETHRRNLIEKLNVSNSKTLIRYAIDNGYA